MKIFLLFVGVFFLLTTASNAATITLANGDVITGEIVQKVDGNTIIKHDVIGGLAVADKDIVSIVETPPVKESVEEISEADPEPKKRNDKLSINAGAQLADGNTNRKLYNLQADYETRKGKNRYILNADYNYGESEGDEDTDNTALLAKYDYFYADKWFWYNSLDYYRDSFQDIDTRVSYSTGLGHQFIDNDTTAVRFELGPSVVYEKTDVDKNTFFAGRWMVDARHTVIKDRLNVFHMQTGLLSFEDTADVSVRAETGVKLPVYQGWHAFAQMNNNFEGAPVANREEFDTQYLLGFGYGW